MVQVFQHPELLYELDTWCLNINTTLISTMKTISHLNSTATVKTDICMGITRLTTGLINRLNGNLDVLHDFMRLLGRQSCQYFY